MSDLKNASVSEVLAAAQDIVDNIASRSSILDPACEASLPRFEDREISVGRVVGRGGFCVVKEITGIRSNEFKASSSSKSSSSFKNGSHRSFGSERSFHSQSSGRLSSKIFSSMRSSSERDEDATSTASNEATKEYLVKAAQRSKSRYVMKRVSDEVMCENRETYLKGSIDLALEAKYLSSLSHPGILSIRGVAATGPFEEGYFIIIDRLKETLPKRLKDWMTVDRQTKGVTGVFTGGKKKVDDLLVKRLLVAFDIASVLGYLHELGVVYRDLKPDNIGFARNGHLKIFDFGLAKELNQAERDEDGLYRLTGFTGSIRYMSPEVGLAKPYNEKADVYSFAILLWYIMALEPPYGLYTPKMITQRVFQEGRRPVIMDAWPAGVKTILTECWNSDINARPNFIEVMEMLREQVVKVSPDSADTMIHRSAKQPDETHLEAAVAAS